MKWNLLHLPNRLAHAMNRVPIFTIFGSICYHDLFEQASLQIHSDKPKRSSGTTLVAQDPHLDISVALKEL